MNGILVVNKPTGITSHQVVANVRRWSGLKKIGHTGTLDPAACGVLPLCIGPATRLAEYMLEQNKAYRAEMVLGVATDTQDATGKVTEAVPKVLVRKEDVERVFASFKCTYQQTPPAFSAIRINGVRAYDWARKGKKPALPSRTVTLYELQIIDMDLFKDHPRIVFHAECSKGTYIRTLCFDIGKALGVPAHMSSLVRTRSGPYGLEHSHTLEEIEEAALEGRLEELLLSPVTAVAFMPSYHPVPQEIRRILNGMHLFLAAQGERRTWCEGMRVRIEAQGRLLAIYRVIAQTAGGWELAAEKVLKE